VGDTGLIMEPTAGREEYEEDDQRHHNVVLPGSAGVIPQNEALQAG